MQWDDVKGFEGLYKVSDSGVVITNYNRNGKHGCELKPYTDKDGYLAVKLYKDGKSINKRINRLVAECFVANPDEKPLVNHKDFDRKNNRAENLEWCTQAENIRYSAKSGRFKGYGQRPVRCIMQNGECKVFESMSDAANSLHIPVANIYKCCNGERKTAGGNRFEYFEVEIEKAGADNE